MMNIKKFIPNYTPYWLLAIGYWLPASNPTLAQDIHFSQFYMSPLTLNPALAGDKDISATTDYRNQWNTISSPFRTIAAGVDMKLLKDKFQNASFGVGFNASNDMEGVGSLSTTQVDLSIAGHVKITEHQILSAGIQAGFGQRSVNFSAFSWGKQYDGYQYNASLPTGEPTGTPSFYYPDLSAGVLYQYKKSEEYVKGDGDFESTFGFSVSHVNQPLISFYSVAGSNAGDFLYLKYTLHGNMLIEINGTPLSILPGFVFYSQGPAQELQAGSLISYRLQQDSKYTSYVKGASIALGAYYRLGDAFVIASLLEFSNYAIGLSYDVNASGLTIATQGLGGFEVSLRYMKSGR